MQVIDNIEKFIEDNNIKMIYLDWDGVITHSCQAIVDICNNKFGTNASGQDVMSWNFRDMFPQLTEEDMEYLFTTDEFFDYLTFVDGVLDFIRKHENEVIIVTKARPNNFIGKVKMLREVGLENVPIIPLPYNLSKGVIDMERFGLQWKEHSLFIDDNTDNLKECSADFKICFKEYKDNKEREWQKKCDLVMYSWD